MDTDPLHTDVFHLRSGRPIGVTEFGNRSSPHVVVLSHPAPGSSLFDPDPEVTAQFDVRVIALDRPGYGLSNVIPGQTVTVAHAADDIAEYLAAQNVTNVGAAGWSAGGRVALALAATRPELVSGVAVVATPAPDSVVPWVGDDNRAMLKSFRAAPPDDAARMLAAMFNEFFGVQPKPDALLTQLITPGIDDAIAHSAHDRLINMLESSALQGNLGTAADIIAYTLLDWGFDPREVTAPTALFYGADDSAIGPQHGEWYRAEVPNAHLELVPHVGHLVMISAWEKVLTHLTGQFSGTS
ncbi:MAG TPA: alpha/beta hydrolase [Glaciihabitans sp.]|nr:alpha/beta hydrolase [Glaciihabitans sp.]